MKKLLAVLLLTIAAAANAFCAPTNQAPASADQLRSEFESALKSKDTNAILSLIYWKDVSAKARSLDEQEAADMVKHEIASVRLSPWPTNNEPLEVIAKGMRYKPNLQVIGMLQVNFVDRPGGVGAYMPFGKVGNTYLMAATIEEPIPPAPAKQ